MNKPKIDISMVDWSKTDIEIAGHLGCSRSLINSYRRRLGHRDSDGSKLNRQVAEAMRWMREHADTLAYLTAPEIASIVPVNLSDQTFFKLARRLGIPRRRTIMESLTKDTLKQHCTVTELGCWEWPDRNPHTGYGMAYNPEKKNRTYIHRFSYELFKGKIPKGQLVLHACDNPPCCNPDHLSIGTQADNVADRDSKGRHKSRFITEDQVREMRLRYANGERDCFILAKDYGTSGRTVWFTVTRLWWKHVA